MALQFTRNARVFVEFEAGASIWEVPVLDGFSFSQAINSSEITISEAGVTSRRARLLFNDNLAPVEWSMSTYARPFSSGSSPAYSTAPEDPLWAMLMGADTYTTGTKLFSNSIVATNVNTHVTGASATNTWDFAGSNTSSFGTAATKVNIYFAFQDGGNVQVYKCADSVVNSVTCDFDIEGIATLQWSGFGQSLVDETTTVPTATITDGITETSNFIRNRISTVDLEWAQASHSPNPDTYSIVLTGGSFSIENNINYLVPEELGLVNKPLANITGARSISGNLTCYLDTDISNSKSGELFADLVSDTSTVRNIFNMAVNVGGNDAAGPNFSLDLPTAHLEVPVINVEDLLTLDVTFHGQVSGGDVDNTDEATIIYRGVDI